jgi:hypothetical protein
MNNETITKILKELAELTEMTANATASLINNGDPLDVQNTEPGSLMRANSLRGQAKAMRKTFDDAIRG